MFGPIVSPWMQVSLVFRDILFSLTLYIVKVFDERFIVDSSFIASNCFITSRGPCAYKFPDSSIASEQAAQLCSGYCGLQACANELEQAAHDPEL